MREGAMNTLTITGVSGTKLICNCGDRIIRSMCFGSVISERIIVPALILVYQPEAVAVVESMTGERRFLGHKVMPIVYVVRKGVGYTVAAHFDLTQPTDMSSFIKDLPQEQYSKAFSILNEGYASFVVSTVGFYTTPQKARFVREFLGEFQKAGKFVLAVCSDENMISDENKVKEGWSIELTHVFRGGTRCPDRPLNIQGLRYSITKRSDHGIVFHHRRA